MSLLVHFAIKMFGNNSKAKFLSVMVEELWVENNTHSSILNRKVVGCWLLVVAAVFHCSV